MTPLDRINSILCSPRQMYLHGEISYAEFVLRQKQIEQNKERARRQIKRAMDKYMKDEQP